MCEFSGVSTNLPFHCHTLHVIMIVNPISQIQCLHHHSVTHLWITVLSHKPSPPLPCPTHLNQPWPSHGGHTMTVMHIIIGGGPLSPGDPLIDLLTKDESVPSKGGGWPGQHWGEEPCVLLRVGIRTSRDFFTLIGTTPEPHTKSITSGAMGTQCGRARGNQWADCGFGFLWESRTSDFTELRNKGEEKKDHEERDRR